MSLVLIRNIYLFSNVDLNNLWEVYIFYYSIKCIAVSGILMYKKVAQWVNTSYLHSQQRQIGNDFEYKLDKEGLCSVVREKSV